MGYGGWLIRRYPELRGWSSADLQALIARAKWQTRMARVMACALCIQMVFYGTLHLLRFAPSAGWLQEMTLTLAILGSGILMCDRVSSAIVKARLVSSLRRPVRAVRTA